MKGKFKVFTHRIHVSLSNHDNAVWELQFYQYIDDEREAIRGGIVAHMENGKIIIDDPDFTVHHTEKGMIWLKKIKEREKNDN